MICYRDMTFCAAACVNRDCPRNPPDDLQERVDRWWGEPGGPVAWADFSPQCSLYAPAQQAPAPASANGQGPHSPHRSNALPRDTHKHEPPERTRESSPRQVEGEQG